jgi:hypothetical protein
MIKKSQDKNLISSLSPHLFWDIDKYRVDLEQDKKLIIQRVMEYGLYKDWQLLYSYYGINEIAKIACTIKDLEVKSAVFLSFLSKVPKENFLCYTTKQSTPRHWNF